MSPVPSRYASVAHRSTPSTSGLAFFVYAPGFRTPFGHYHREQEEAYVVVGGSG